MRLQKIWSDKIRQGYSFGPALPSAPPNNKSESTSKNEYLTSPAKIVRIIVGLLTAHCRLNRHMHHIAKNAIYRFSTKEEETPVHVLCHCEYMARTRFLVPGLENSTVHCYIKKPLSKQISLI